MEVGDWIIRALPYIFVGAYAGWIGSRQNRLKEDFGFFKEGKFKFVEDDVRDLAKLKYELINRDELNHAYNALKEQCMNTCHLLELRIVALETKLDERFGVDK